MNTSNVSDKQLVAGLRAVHEWMRINGTIEVSNPAEKLAPPATLVIRGGTGLHDAEVAVLIDLVTSQTIFTANAKNAMFVAVDWKKGKKNRMTALFLPQGLLASGKEALGLYDQYIEYPV